MASKSTFFGNTVEDVSQVLTEEDDIDFTRLEAKETFVMDDKLAKKIKKEIEVYHFDLEENIKNNKAEIKDYLGQIKRSSNQEIELKRDQRLHTFHLVAAKTPNWMET
jgi:hypothetical protein